MWPAPACWRATLPGSAKRNSASRNCSNRCRKASTSALREGKLLEVNPALVTILGYESKEELLSLPPDAAERRLRRRAGAGTREARAAAPARAKSACSRKDGGVAVCVDTSTGVMEDGRIVRYQGTLVDVTEKRALERQLRRQEEFRRHLLESFPDLILVLDLKGTVHLRQLAHPRTSRLRSGTPDGQERRRCREHFAGTGRRSIVRSRPAKMSLTSCEYGARHQDGSWRTMLGMASPLLDTEGKPAGVIISVRDVTTEKKLEQQIIQSERLAAMGQMIGGFAHELNNPLTSILGMAELLQEGEVSEGAAQAARRFCTSRRGAPLRSCRTCNTSPGRRRPDAARSI